MRGTGYILLSDLVEWVLFDTHTESVYEAAEKSYMEDESDDFDFWLKFWLSILKQRFELRGHTLGLVKSYTKDNQRADIICN